jgi:hypothetical protein
MEARAAAAGAARQRARRAIGMLRAAAPLLAQAAEALEGDFDVVAELRIADLEDVDRALELVRLARSRHGELELVVLARR